MVDCTGDCCNFLQCTVVYVGLIINELQCLSEAVFFFVKMEYRYS